MTVRTVALLTSGGLAPCLSSAVGALIEEYTRVAPDVRIIGYLDGYAGLLTGRHVEITDEVRATATRLHAFGGSPLGNSRVKLTNADDLVRRGLVEAGQDPLRVAAAQLAADGVALAVFPELCLTGYSIEDLLLPTGRLTRSRDVAWEGLNAIDGVSCVKPKGALYAFPKLDPNVHEIRDDEQMVLDLLNEEKILLVQGTGFNWPTPDHLRVVTLPWARDLAEALDRFGNFLSSYKQK